jgi:hypothetical protein
MGMVISLRNKELFVIPMYTDNFLLSFIFFFIFFYTLAYREIGICRYIGLGSISHNDLSIPTSILLYRSVYNIGIIL